MCYDFLLQRQVSMTTALVRHHGRSVHKRSTIEILVRGKTSGGSGGAGGPGGGGDTPQGCYSHPHRFEKYNNTTPSYCDHCTCLLWGPLKVRIGEMNPWNTWVWIRHVTLILRTATNKCIRQIDWYTHCLHSLQTGLRCVDCGYNCHEKCIESVPKNCTRFKSAVRESGVSIPNSIKPSSLDTTSVGSGQSSYFPLLLNMLTDNIFSIVCVCGGGI